MIDNAFISHESGTDAEGIACARWEAWCDKAAKLAGVTTLDGDQAKDGYSLDEALKVYESGTPAGTYAATVREIIAAKNA